MPCVEGEQPRGGQVPAMLAEGASKRESEGPNILCYVDVD
jgi:hypothetical protein